MSGGSSFSLPLRWRRSQRVEAGEPEALGRVALVLDGKEHPSPEIINA